MSNLFTKQVKPTRAIIHFKSVLPTVLILVIVLFGNKNANAQYYPNRLPIGFIFHHYQSEAVQRQGQNTDYRGIINGGVTAGGFGVNGYNYGNQYTYQRQQTVYQNVAYFWFNDGRTCIGTYTASYNIPRGYGVYDKYGNPWTYNLYIFN